MSEQNQNDVLASLMPTEDLKVMDLVAEAGIDVDPWAVRKDGTPVANPRANPNYCYEWAFGENQEPIALCVWHESLRVDAGEIVYEGNMRVLAARIEEIGFDRNASSEVKSRAKSQAKRCDRFDRRVQIAFRRALPLRVILLQGQMAGDLGQDASKVESRLLDEMDWWVDGYNDATGDYRFVRGQRRASNPLTDMDDAASGEQGEYVDQFSIDESPERKQRTIDAIARSPEVRRQVLERSAGSCERCGRRGFATPSGGIYLETHHVVPLCENGADTVANVVALCPDDHRRAHYGEERAAIRDELLAHLKIVSSTAVVA